MPIKGHYGSPESPLESQYGSVHEAFAEVGSDAQIHEEEGRIVVSFARQSPAHYESVTKVLREGGVLATTPVYKTRLLRAQTGRSRPWNVNNIEMTTFSAESLSERSSDALEQISEPGKDNNTRRFLALAGIVGVAAGLLVGGAATGLGLYYGLIKADADKTPPPDGIPPTVAELIRDLIRKWNAEYADDAAFWTHLADYVADDALQPPLTLADNIPFCTYVTEFFPTLSFIFNNPDDPTLFVVRLVNAYQAAKASGAKDAVAAGSMYKAVAAFRYSQQGKPEAPFPRQVQAMLLRWAFEAVVYPSAMIQLTALAQRNAELQDDAYWNAFAAFMEDISQKPPLTVEDQIEFCNITVSLSPLDADDVRPDAFDPVVSELLKSYDPANKLTATMIRAVAGLKLAGQPLSRRRQAHVLRLALAKVAASGGGLSLYQIVRKNKNLSDADYWTAFVQYMTDPKTRPPIIRLDEVHFCSYTVEQFPLTSGVVLTPAEAQAYLDALAAEFAISKSTLTVYPKLAGFNYRGGSLPRGIQAQLMRQALVQFP